MNTFTLNLGDTEVRALRAILESSIYTCKACAQLALTGDAERELYRQKVDVASHILDVIS